MKSLIILLVLFKCLFSQEALDNAKIFGNYEFDLDRFNFEKELFEKFGKPLKMECKTTVNIYYDNIDTLKDLFFFWIKNCGLSCSYLKRIYSYLL